MTMKKIRHQLNAIFGVDLSDRKDFLGLQVRKQSTILHLVASGKLKYPNKPQLTTAVEQAYAEGCMHNFRRVLWLCEPASF